MVTDFNLLSKTSWSQHSVCALLIVCAVFNIPPQENNNHHTVVVSQADGTEHSKGLGKTQMRIRSCTKKAALQHNFPALGLTQALPAHKKPENSSSSRAWRRQAASYTPNREHGFVRRFDLIPDLILNREIIPRPEGVKDHQQHRCTRSLVGSRPALVKLY